MEFVKSVLVMVTIMFWRIVECTSRTISMIAYSALISPIGFTVGVGIFIWLSNNISWYLDIWLYTWLVHYLVYLLSYNYREWSKLALGFYQMVLDQKYP